MSGLWAVGCYDDADGARAPWRISNDEINRDIGSATRVLQGLGIAGKGVLWCSMLANAGQFWPYVCGTVMAGGRISCADATKGEAVRVAMFLRLMSCDAVFGVTSAILDGLDETGKAYDEVFANVRIVGAYADAHRRLETGGVPPSHFAVCGPAIALAAEPGAPARVADDEWELSADNDRVCVTARNERAQEFARTPVGVRGAIVDGGVVPWPDR